MDGNGIIDSKEELAKHFGKRSVRTVYRWIDAGMPIMPDGRFDILEVTAWRRRKKGASVPGDSTQGRRVEDDPFESASLGAGSGTSPLDDKDHWDKESKKEQALYRKMMRLKSQRELIELRSVEDMFIGRILEVKTLLLGLERTLPPELIRCNTDREMAEVIRKFVRRALNQFSRPLPEEMRPATPDDHQ